MTDIAKFLIVGGCLLIVCGIILYAFGKIPGIGKLPGDILIKRENMTFYLPITTCIIASLIVSLLLYLWNQK